MSCALSKYENGVQTKTWLFMQDSSESPCPKPDLAMSPDSYTSRLSLVAYNFQINYVAIAEPDLDNTVSPAMHELEMCGAVDKGKRHREKCKYTAMLSSLICSCTWRSFFLVFELCQHNFRAGSV